MDRRAFIINTSLTAFAVSTFGTVLGCKKEDLLESDGVAKFVGDCETTNDILGPFYRPDAPIRSDLTCEVTGNIITLKGQILADDCVTPIEQAQIEIWHCDTQGDYDNSSPDFLQRGRLLTDAEGNYAFKTILPGKYLNGQLYRPAHIHFRVTAEGKREIISQVYFEGDPDIAADPWASKEAAKLRILDMIPEDVNGGITVHFDIYMVSE